MKNRIASLLLAALLGGCATSPPAAPVKDLSPSELFQLACDPGKTVHLASGDIWLKANSPDFSGQFPASIIAKEPDQLKIEVTNILGGTEALIQVDSRHYEITKTRDQGQNKREGFGSWNGVPLQWATVLFLGKIPCPSPDRKDLKMSLTSDGKLSVQVPELVSEEPQEFLFGFKEENGKQWPSSLRWSRVHYPNAAVDFTFDDPEKTTLSPQKWEVHSQQGSIKVRWRDRKTSL